MGEKKTAVSNWLCTTHHIYSDAGDTPVLGRHLTNDKTEIEYLEKNVFQSPMSVATNRLKSVTTGSSRFPDRVSRYTL